MAHHHRNIHPSHTEVVARLEEKYAHLGIRFYQDSPGPSPSRRTAGSGAGSFTSASAATAPPSPSGPLTGTGTRPATRPAV
jgi:hypothetical protein